MNIKLVEDIAAAILYEGYILYPYRASSVKNRQRWNFGVLYPRRYAEAQTGADAWSMRTECLVEASPEARLSVRVRFLRQLEDNWQEGELAHACALADQPCCVRQEFAGIQGVLEIEIAPIQANLYKASIRISNATESCATDRDDALRQSMISVHAILGIEGGAFISLLEPPEQFREVAAGCENVGVWPVLVGEPGQRDAMLASPIILYDYPQIAPESPGPLFDGTEIDEILTLRIMTLTDQEKLEMAQDDRAREILERTESMPVEQFMKMHGVMRERR